jgi:type I restriction enzyme S subunit
MNAERLLAHFETISEAPDSVARLRRFILDLAVRGKLVEPPRSWLECSLGDVGDWGSGGTPLRTKPEYYGGDIPWLVIGDLNDGLVTASATTITEEGLSNSSAKVVDEGTLLIAMYGSIGKLGVAGMRCATNQAIAFCRPYSDMVTGDYLFILLKSLRNELLLQGQGVAQQNISQKILKAHPVELPALAEQHRIVAKVDELMALCDQLEASRQQREQNRTRLVAASLQRLNQPAEDPASFRQDASFALQVLPSLTTTPAQIKQLRQTILNLAVRGKLVEQDPEDEPVESYLKLIKAHPIDHGDFGTPCQWAWVSVGEVSSSRLGKMLDKAKNKGTERPYLRNINVRWLDFDLSDLLEMRFEESELSEYELQKGDVLICEGGEPGRAAVWDDRARGVYFQKAIHRVRFDECVDPFFFVYVLRCSALDERLSKYFTGTGISHFTGKSLKGYLFPLPPLAEQHRIVAKVDELMALCDQLEQQLSQADQQRRRLLEALSAEALREPEKALASAGSA